MALATLKMWTKIKIYPIENKFEFSDWSAEWRYFPWWGNFVYSATILPGLQNVDGIILRNCTALLVGSSRDLFPVVSLGIFSVVPPTEPCALRSTQPLKMSNRHFSWGKGGQCVWLMTYHPCRAETSRKSGTLTYPEPLGPPQPVAGNLYLLYFAFSF